MLPKKKTHPKVKSGLHQRNKHRERYDFKALIVTCPELGPFVRMNEYNDESIDFSKPEAVMQLNKALLKHYYKIKHWQVPAGYLCPPVPGRADYLHHIADMLANCNQGVIPTGSRVRCLDIGVGANCIYPIIGNNEYGWSFVGTDVDPVAISAASEIVEINAGLTGNVEMRLQSNPKDVFRGIIKEKEHFDLTICNPPFHASFEAAQSVNLRKLSNLNKRQVTKQKLNFGGSNNELWCPGGEEKFVHQMILQSKQFSASCFWFSTLISKSSHLKNIYETLKMMGATEVKTIPMSQGNKISRIVAWTYLNKEEQANWVNARWKKWM